MNKDTLIELLEPHKQHLTTTKKWDEYAKEHNLPPSVTLIYHFDSWSNVKNAFGVFVKKNIKYTKSELVEIGKKHQEYFHRKLIWDKHSVEHGLPASATYIKRFGSWQKAKEQIGLRNVKRKNDIYTKEMLEKVLKEHGKNFINRKQWDEYAKEHRIPTWKTIKKHFEYAEILDFAGKGKKELIRIALQHQEHFLNSSMTKWDEYAAENDLPSSNKFHKVFGSWNKAKTEVSMRK
jgi:hypothetical protein